ncbi:myosin-2 essential light chain-like [Acropora millepora]|uniref:myosin-2 essential light chain-like n=1 Tax=Acropora millepora TaxID=45264 RepID=UPI001CF3EB93|nr:myosin-2 essential light chain-like [Acropora millepora]
MISPEDSTEECKEAFYLYDSRGDGKVECKQIGEVMRALGTNPTEAQISKIIRGLDPVGTGVKRVSFEEFFPIYQNLRDRQKKSGVYPEYFIECLRVFDRGCNGLVNASELRHVLCNLGDKLTLDEVNQLLAAFEDNTGHVMYEEFVKQVMTG